jgi:hypothetical protein
MPINATEFLTRYIKLQDIHMSTNAVVTPHNIYINVKGPVEGRGTPDGVLCILILLSLKTLESK